MELFIEILQTQDPLVQILRHIPDTDLIYKPNFLFKTIST